jgi:hypothetical protein
MKRSMNSEIETWEGEGGAAFGPLGLRTISMSGTANQVEWAERIRRQVNDEFDRVAAAFQSIADKQNDDRGADTKAIIAILEDKRTEVVNREQAGYFIHDWQEIGDQVRQMIFHDPRYQAIRGNRLRPVVKDQS